MQLKIKLKRIKTMAKRLITQVYKCLCCGGSLAGVASNEISIKKLPQKKLVEI